MNYQERIELSKAPIVWTGDLDDDCSADWAGLLLRAEWMDKENWWWEVSDMQVAGQPAIDGANERDESCRGGKRARMLAEQAARAFIENLKP